MTESDIIRLAKMAGAQPTNDTCDAQYVITAEGLAHFAALIRQDEAQACAKYYLAAIRKWVGLTDEEIAEGAKQSWVEKQAFESAAWWTEAKLREKNGY